jgi:hypothetical protein
MEGLGGYQIDRFAAVLGDLNRFFEGPVVPKPEVLLNVEAATDELMPPTPKYVTYVRYGY